MFKTDLKLISKFKTPSQPYGLEVYARAKYHYRGKKTNHYFQFSRIIHTYNKLYNYLKLLFCGYVYKVVITSSEYISELSLSKEVLMVFF